MRGRLPIVALLLVLAGCSSGVNRATPDAVAAAQGPHRVGQASVAVAPSAQRLLADNLDFDLAKFEVELRRVLVLRGALVETTDATADRLEVQLVDLRTRSTLGAVMLGFLAGDDRLRGDVIRRGADGEIRQRFEVNASYAFGGLAGGQSVRLDWLYRTFAEQIADELGFPAGASPAPGAPAPAVPAAPAPAPAAPPGPPQA